MQQAVGMARRQCRVLQILADDAGALLVAAAEQIPAIMVVRRGRVGPVLVTVIVLVCHGAVPAAAGRVRPRQFTPTAAPIVSPIGRCKTRSARSSSPVGSRLTMTSAAPLRFASSGNPAA